MRARLLIGLLVLVLALPVAAQDCENGKPCGVVPWRLMSLPDLSSPTPAPTLALTQQITATPGPSPTPGSSPTAVPPTAEVDTQQLVDQVATLQSMVNATQPVLMNPSGTPMAISDEFGNVESGAYGFFMYAKGISAVNMGSLTPFFTFFVSAFLLFILTTLATFFVPLLSTAFKLVREAVEALMKIFLK